MTLKPSLDSLPLITLIIGLCTAAPALFALIAPSPAAKMFKAFPRSIWPGRVLAVFCVAWATVWSAILPFEWCVMARPYYWIIMPVTIGAIWIFTPELLSCRAFGLLLVLVPTPMLTSAQWSLSAFRFVVIIYAYALAIIGMFYIALPYLLRDHIAWSFANPLRTRAVSAAFATLGTTLVILSFIVF